MSIAVLMPMPSLMRIAAGEDQAGPNACSIPAPVVARCPVHTPSRSRRKRAGGMGSDTAATARPPGPRS